MIHVFSDCAYLYCCVCLTQVKKWKKRKTNILVLVCFIVSFTSTFTSQLHFFASLYRTRPMSLNMEPCMAGACVCSLSSWLTASYVLLSCLLVSSWGLYTSMHSHTLNTFIVSSVDLFLLINSLCQPLPETLHTFIHTIHFRSLPWWGF